MDYFSSRFVEEHITVPNIEPNNNDHSEQKLCLDQYDDGDGDDDFNDDQSFNQQEVSIHVYEKRGTERVGRGRRKEAIAEILKVIEID